LGSTGVVGSQEANVIAATATKATSLCVLNMILFVCLMPQTYRANVSAGLNPSEQIFLGRLIIFC
jgi:hypothetical protein